MPFDRHHKIQERLGPAPLSFALRADDHGVLLSKEELANERGIGCSLHRLLDRVEKHPIQLMDILLVSTLILLPAKRLRQVCGFPRPRIGFLKHNKEPLNLEKEVLGSLVLSKGSLLVCALLTKWQLVEGGSEERVHVQGLEQAVEVAGCAPKKMPRQILTDSSDPRSWNPGAGEAEVPSQRRSAQVSLNNQSQ